MLTDRDKLDIFYLTKNLTHDVDGDCSRLDLAIAATSRTIHFIIEHPDMCAAEFDDFLLDSEYALQEFQRIAGGRI